MSLSDLIKKTKVYTTKNDTDAILNVSTLAQQILNDILEVIQPGISESQATEAAHLILRKYAVVSALLWGSMRLLKRS